MGVDARLSITQIFSAFPRSDAALASADVSALAANTNNYNFSGVDKYVVEALAAGQDIDFRIGDGWTTANDLTNGKEVGQGISFPPNWKFPTE